MPSMARLGDLGVGVCCCHKNPQPYVTVFVSGAITVGNDKLDTSVISTVGVSSCGHPTIALTGSPSVFAEKKAVHRVGDTGANCSPYVTITGSSKQFANDRS